MLKKPFYYTVSDRAKRIEKIRKKEEVKDGNNYLSSSKMLAIVGGNIRSIRKSHKITIGRLAEKAKISEKYLQGVEVGKRNISIANLYKIATTLKVNLGVFFVENKSKVNEKVMFIESKLKRYTKEQLAYIEMLIEDVKSIIDKSVQNNNSVVKDKIDVEEEDTFDYYEDNGNKIDIEPNIIMQDDDEDEKKIDMM